VETPYMLKQKADRCALVVRDKDGWIMSSRHLPNSSGYGPDSEPVLVQTDAHYWPNVGTGSYDFEEGGGWSLNGVQGNVIKWQPIPGRELDVCEVTSVS